MRKPTFFISSTIYDFKDLRSCLKYYLEELGCRVLSSENTDFRVDLNKDSYQACLDAIASADYFVLLIGARVGGWYDKQNRISITMQEYREAYKLHKQGTIKILAFVRNEIWELRENRGELRKFLATSDLSPAQRQSVQNHQTKQCEDADFIIGFINEVARNAEMKQALEGKIEGFPSGNWIFNFTGFRDIVAAIQSQVLMDAPIEEATLKHLLAIELRANLRALLWKSKGNLFTPELTVENFYIEHKVTKSMIGAGPFMVDGKRWSLLTTWSFHLMGVILSDRILEHCLKSSAFLEYDRQSGRVRGTAVLESLQALSEEIRRFRASNTTETLVVLYEFSKRSGYSRDRPVPVPPEKLLPLLHLFDRWINIIRISRAVLVHLQGAQFVKPELRPRSPIPDMNPELESEAVTDEELESYLHKNNVE